MQARNAFGGLALVVAAGARTTGVRAVAVDGNGAGWAYRELAQHYPRSSWVEHDPDEIWHAVQATLHQLTGELEGTGQTVAAIGVTNQRETVVAWDRRTARPLQHAIVWQDRRTVPHVRRPRGGRPPRPGEEHHRARPVGRAGNWTG